MLTLEMIASPPRRCMIMFLSERSGVPAAEQYRTGQSRDASGAEGDIYQKLNGTRRD
ncbi:hypothetical protein ACHAPZ_005212 [Fusarium culmorum]